MYIHALRIETSLSIIYTEAVIDTLTAAQAKFQLEVGVKNVLCMYAS
jgi:hypothetical protein